jgi:outer membrane protein assembly factor BamB/tRNA A-37 threonylcarbamoyl transferase component Bud32
MDLDTHRITQSFSPGQQPEKQLQSGNILQGRYLIQEVVGVGGMGSVYRARDLHFPNVVKLVAVKEMINQARDLQVRQTIVSNFEREANILATLNHASIPRIFDYFSHEERSYLVLEYVNGHDLEEILNSSDMPIPEERAVSWAIELCDVLEYLHNHKPEPIIFRDMKPSNVMVNQDNHIVLVDFGIAKMFRSGQKGTMIGTEGYSPPEQYRGEATPLADIYALGATLHHLLTRRDPRIETPFTFNERPVRKLNPIVSVELEAVINTAVQYNPTERFQTAAAMKDALMAAARKTGILGRIASAGVTVVKKDEVVKPVWTFRCEDEIRGGAAIDNGILYVGAYDNNLYALNVTDGSFVWKFPTEGAVVGKPAFGDSNVLFGSKDKRLYAVNARTGRINWTYQTEGPIFSSPRVAEGYAFVGSDDGYLHLVNLMNGRGARFNCEGAVRSSPLINSEGLIFVANEEGYMFCLDGKGAIKWRQRAKRGVTASPLLNKGLVYFASLDGTFYIIEARSGFVQGRFRMQKGSVTTPCNLDNQIFVGSADENMYCIDGSSTREIWRFKADHQVSGSPAVYRDSLYFGDASGGVYCLESRSGRLRWKYQTGGPITATPIVYNDILYVGSSDHILYALWV